MDTPIWNHSQPPSPGAMVMGAAWVAPWLSMARTARTVISARNKGDRRATSRSNTAAAANTAVLALTETQSANDRSVRQSAIAVVAATVQATGPTTATASRIQNRAWGCSASPFQAARSAGSRATRAAMLRTVSAAICSVSRYNGRLEHRPTRPV